jgi:hypothetical protein
MQVVQDLVSQLQFNFGGIHFETWQVLAIIFLLFLLVVTMASVRRHFLEWSVRGAGFGVLLGFILAVVVEGFLLVGGRSILIETFGWKNPPKPIQRALDVGKQKFTEVLGIATSSATLQKNANDIVQMYQSLPPSEHEQAKRIICTP